MGVDKSTIKAVLVVMAGLFLYDTAKRNGWL